MLLLTWELLDVMMWKGFLKIIIKYIILVSDLYSQLGYFTDEFQALQLIVPAVFGDVD